jgi:hypothetical protein
MQNAAVDVMIEMLDIRTLNAGFVSRDLFGEPGFCIFLRL